MRRVILRVSILFLFSAALMPTVNWAGERVMAWRYPYQRMADAAPWRFSREECGRDFCIGRASNSENYILRTKPVDTSELSELLGWYTLDVCRRDGSVAFSHSTGIYFDGFLFQIVGDRLYAVTYSEGDGGFWAEAIDLRHGSALWHTSYPMGLRLHHSRYRNAININGDANVLQIRGDEDAGQYLVILDGLTGEMLGYHCYEWRMGGSSLSSPSAVEHFQNRYGYMAGSGVFALGVLWIMFYDCRKRRRLRMNCCLRCGYDLRATPDRCPECGFEGAGRDAGASVQGH